MEKKQKRTYTIQERTEVLSTVKKKGVCAAAREHGVSQGNVSKWAKAAGVKREDAAWPQPEFEAQATQPWSQAAPQPSEPPPGPPPPPPPGPLAPLPPNRAPAASPQDRPTLCSPPTKPRVAKSYTPSQREVILKDAAGNGVTQAAQQHKVSRFSIYDWRGKEQRAAAGQGPSPTTGPSQQDIEQKRDAEILEEYKSHPGLGPSQIRNQLRRRHIRVSVHTARRVMETAGYRPPKVERRKHDRRYEAVRPNHLWHLDFVQRFIGKSSTFTLILIDDCSRFVVGHGVDDAERAQMVIDTFEEAVRRHGRPEQVMHDKGSAFWNWRGISRFTALLSEMGIDQIVAEHKEWNGKVEAFNGNLHKELFDAHRFSDVAQMRRGLAAHLSFYNTGRTHHALGGLCARDALK